MSENNMAKYVRVLKMKPRLDEYKNDLSEIKNSRSAITGVVLSRSEYIDKMILEVDEPFATAFKELDDNMKKVDEVRNALISDPE